jgi:hypothetical protein
MSKEAETLRYDSRTPKFEGIAHEQVDGDEELEWMEGGVEGARKRANNFPVFLSDMNSDGKVTWGGFEFNVCRAHFVYNLLVESIAEGSPILVR